MERFGSELIFISRIAGNGENIYPVEHEEANKFCKTETYKLTSLSLSNGTYIASGMSSYVVKLKNPPR